MKALWNEKSVTKYEGNDEEYLEPELIRCLSMSFWGLLCLSALWRLKLDTQYSL